MVLINNNIIKCDFSYILFNKFDIFSTICSLKLTYNWLMNDVSFFGNLQGHIIDTHFDNFFIVYHWNNYTPP